MRPIGIVSLGAFSFADLWVTAYALSNNLDTEANPVMRAAFDLDMTVAFAIKLALLVGIGMLLYRLPRHIGIVVVWVGCALYLSVLVLNLQAIGGI